MGNGWKMRTEDYFTAFITNFVSFVDFFFIDSLLFSAIQCIYGSLIFLFRTFQVWIFGDLWCSIWLAVDVWMCTASILNLCAISLDRYVAVTRPVTYPSIMSTKRAKLLVAGVWVLSFVICLPQLVGLTQNHKVSMVALQSLLVSIHIENWFLKIY